VTDSAGIPRPAPDWTVRHVAETGSTNADLIAAAEAGSAADRTVLRADHQRAGRGRLDRRWEAPAGVNLLASILFTDPPPVPATLPQAVARAALDAIEELDGDALDGRLGLKWPNDLLLDGRKLAGVLSQRSPQTGAVVVGIGLNVGWAPSGAASLSGDLGLDTAPLILLDRLLAHLGVLLAEAEVATRYRARLATLGQRVRVGLPGGRSTTGIAVDLDGEGRLVIDTEPAGERVTLDVGDIVHLRRV
jgi:BirA family biotin operon repressor/biotin-[acetyl-CoA-carboxylase] ligase